MNLAWNNKIRNQQQQQRNVDVELLMLIMMVVLICVSSQHVHLLVGSVDSCHQVTKTSLLPANFFLLRYNIKFVVANELVAVILM